MARSSGSISLLLLFWGFVPWLNLFNKASDSFQKLLFNPKPPKPQQPVTPTVAQRRSTSAALAALPGAGHSSGRGLCELLASSTGRGSSLAALGNAAALAEVKKDQASRGGAGSTLGAFGLRRGSPELISWF